MSFARGKRPYLSICAIYRDAAPYLREWIEFHRLVGVERFFLYDNASVDDHNEVIAPYVASEIVVLHNWPLLPMAQVPAYEHCLSEHRNDSRWIAFIDVDEFLFSPTGQPVSEMLVDYEQWPGVGVNWAMFGSSGHRTKPSGLVIESYLRRSDAAGTNNVIKSIVDPTRARCGTAHYFFYQSGQAVDEQKRPIDEGVRWAKSLSFSRLRINHYWTKSAEEYRRKWGREKPDTGKLRKDDFAQFEVALNERVDETILMYLPALRDALSREGPLQGKGTAVEASRRGN